MNRFEWMLARSAREAARHATAVVADAMVAAPGRPLPADAAILKAGGMDVLDLMKERVLAPHRMVQIGGVPGLDRLETANPISGRQRDIGDNPPAPG